jgi:electron transfer flavoprotein alpha subunit
MTALVLLEFDAAGIKQPSRSAVAAAQKLGDVHALVAGSGIEAAGQAAAKLPGVAKVLTADVPALDHAAFGNSKADAMQHLHLAIASVQTVDAQQRGHATVPR